MQLDRIPAFIDTILGWRWIGFAARLLLVGAYPLDGIVKATDWPAAVAEQAYFGMRPPALWAALMIAIEIVGPLLILSGRLVWLGAGMLGAFTVLTTLTANAFWAMPLGSERFMATNAFFKHLWLVGGFILAAMLPQGERYHG